MLFISGKYGQKKDFSKFYENITNSFRLKDGVAEAGQTRLCLDAWNRLEIGAEGSVAPCCIFSKLWHIDKPKQMDLGLKHLRKSLLSGNLNYLCQKCLSKPLVSTKELLDEVQKRKDAINDNDLLSALPLEVLNVGVTESCNLRCTYCSLSDNNYVGKHMSEATFKTCLELIKQSPEDAIIEMYGHGELTFHPHWKPYCESVLNFGRRIHAITNLATNLHQEDFDLLARFYTLWISLDSNDEEMMKNIRRKVSPLKIYEKVRRIQEAAKQQNIPGPKITFSVGVYEPSIWTLDSFMEDLVKLEIHSVVFWDLIDIPSLENVIASRLVNLDEAQTKKANI